MLYKHGRCYWMRFKWNGILIRESTRAEDLATAKKILKMRRSKLAIEQQRRLSIGRAAVAEGALRKDIKNLGTKGKPVESALIAGRENARKRIEKLEDNMAIRKLAAPHGATALGSYGNDHRHTSPSSSDIACSSFATPVSAHRNVATDTPVITVDWLDEACGVWPGRLYRIPAELASATPNGVTTESSAEPLF